MAIFYAHDVQPEPSAWGVTPDQFEELLDILADTEVEVLDVRTARRSFA